MGVVIIVLNICVGILGISSAQFNSTHEALQLSNNQDTWVNIPAECYMAGWKDFNHEHLSQLQDKLPLNESIWVDARAKAAPYFVFHGCFKLRQALYKTNFEENSVSKCLSYCEGKLKTYYFGLMELTCLCLEAEHSVSVHMSTSCNTSCPGNFNDWCGDNKAMALYAKDIPKKSLRENIDEACVIAFNNTYHSGTCSASYEFKCAGEASQTSAVSWSIAVETCRQKKSYLDTRLREFLSTIKPIWTPIKRSSNISWDTNRNVSEFPWCVSIRKNQDMDLSLHEEHCEKKLRQLLICEPAGHETAADEHVSADGDLTDVDPISAVSDQSDNVVAGNVDIANDTYGPIDDERETSDEDLKPVDGVDAPSNTTEALVASIAGLTIFVILCVLAIVVYYKKRKNKSKPRTNVSDNVETGARHGKQTPDTADRVQSAYASIQDAASNPGATGATCADTYDTSYRDTCGNKTINVYDHTIITVKKDRGDENVYDHTITTERFNPHSDNVYDHMARAVKHDRNKENVYAHTSTPMKNDRNAENVYDHTSKVSKQTRQTENVYDHTSNVCKEVRQHENVYDRASAPGKECSYNENAYDVSG